MPPRNGGRAKGVAPKAASAAAVATSAPSATMQATGVQSSLPTSYADAAFFGLRTRSGPIYTYWSIHLLLAGAMLALLIFSIFRAYMVRMYSVQEYGYLIHEFDPWFNFRATQYFSDHGWNSFFSWFDYMSWYPLGRPVGSTTYPGLQITAVALHRTLAAVGVPMSLNDVCVLIPAWFGAVATFILALLTYEVSGSMWAAAMAAYTFSIIPAHMMRSMAGEFDNECIAVSAMLLTFYLWVRSLRTPGSWPIGIFAGLAYGYMVAAWGGYIFVLNMVAVHAASCVLLDWARNVYSPALVRAYTLFFVVGTAIAVCVPPVGWSPFKSLEQLGALLVLLGLWALHISEIWRRRADVEVQSKKCLRIRANAACVLCAMLVVASMVIAPSGYFGPLSSRVRALFVAHTRTGNPLVDSVAEHRAANSGAYIRYLGMCYPLWGLGVLHLSWMPTNNVRGVLFLVLLSIITHYFCGRMVRLLILTGPPACTASACLVARLAKWSVQQAFWDEEKTPVSVLIEAEEAPVAAKEGGTSKKSASNSSRSASSPAPRDRLLKVVDPIFLLNHTKAAPRFLVVSVLVLLVAVLVVPAVLYFDRESLKMSFAFANPRIVTKARDPQTGQQFVFDDYYQSYLWLRDNTPQDARVLAWWDYGYQITGIGNRTSLADGNTWNHEHIATLGKLLTSPVPEAYSLIRHLADYVLIWANQGGDLGKSPHMARIGNSVYRDICPKDPLCEHFGFFSRDYSQPSPMMRASLLYNLHEHEHTNGVRVSPKQFKEVYTSRYHLVRIFKVMNVSKESKQWLADPANRVCSPPGSWLCPGQYPPAPEIQSMLAKRMDFGQLEDFNRGKKDDAYYAAYMNRMRQR